MKVYLEPRDQWIGHYYDGLYHYVCLLPCVVLRWRRRRGPRFIPNDRSEVLFMVEVADPEHPTVAEIEQGRNL